MMSRYKTVSAWPLLVACSLFTVASVALAGGPPPPVEPCTVPLDVPTITCVSSTPSSITRHVCAGASGAPAGISIQWKLCSDFDVNSWSSGSGGYAAISLSGVCPTSNWDLGPNQCRDITINANVVINENAGACGASGNPYDLACNTCYVFRAFAHNDPGPGGCNQSGFSETIRCTTAPCPTSGDCTLTWGYWKTHGPAGCNPSGNADKWPTHSLACGGLTLNGGEICDIFQTNPGACSKGGTTNSGANAVIILEHQLLAAEFNVANGAISCAFATQAIADANALLDGFENACVGTSTPTGQLMVAAASTLESYNSDQCTCPNSLLSKPNATPKATTDVKHSTWGSLKSIYR
jgi:hypothetical protein